VGSGESALYKTQFNVCTYQRRYLNGHGPWGKCSNNVIRSMAVMACFGGKEIKVQNG
jgi:hypothetical protein